MTKPNCKKGLHLVGATTSVSEDWALGMGYRFWAECILCGDRLYAKSKSEYDLATWNSDGTRR